MPFKYVCDIFQFYLIQFHLSCQLIHSLRVNCQIIFLINFLLILCIDLWSLRSHRLRYIQILLNILLNCRKFCICEWVFQFRFYFFNFFCLGFNFLRLWFLLSEHFFIKYCLEVRFMNLNLSCMNILLTWNDFILHVTIPIPLKRLPIHQQILF